MAAVVLTAVVAGVGAVLAHATVPGGTARSCFAWHSGARRGWQSLTPTARATECFLVPRASTTTIRTGRRTARRSRSIAAWCGAGGCAIFTIRPDGTGLRRLGPRRNDRGAPAWSPNGKAIAFSRGWGPIQDDWIKFNELYVMNASGTARASSRASTRRSRSRRLSAAHRGRRTDSNSSSRQGPRRAATRRTAARSSSSTRTAPTSVSSPHGASTPENAPTGLPTAS